MFVCTCRLVRVGVVVFAVLVHVLPCAAQRVLKRWDFSEGKGGWVAGNGCAPLSVRDGRLVVSVTGFDPYTYSSRGADFSIEVHPGIYLRMTARCNLNEAAEFFWSGSTDDRKAGFVAGQEIHFRMHGDGRDHVYSVFPGWEGRVTRLRFDPPGGKDQGVVVEIACIELVELPPARGAQGPAWDFGGSLAGFTPGAYVEDFSIAPDGVALTGFGPAATLVNENLSLRAADCPWLTLDAVADASTVLTVMWRVPDGTYSKSRVRVRLPAGKTHHVVRLADVRTWRGEITGLRLQWAAPSEPLRIRFRHLELGATPAGPPRLDVFALGMGRAYVVRGEPVTVRAELRNAGGAPLVDVELTVREGTHALGRGRTPRLAPGERAAVEMPVALDAVGEHELTLACSTEGSSDAARALGIPAIRATVVPQVPAVQDTPAEAGVYVWPEQAVLSTGTMRLRAPAHPDGKRYGPLFLEVLGESWRLVAVLPACGGLAAGGGEYRELPWGAVSASREARDSCLRFDATYRDAAGTQWTSTAEYRLTSAPDRVAMTHTLRSGARGEVWRFDGPVVRAGDGTYGSRKFEGLFPGLEYLSADEVSSSDRDILPPGDLRVVPHPNRVCIPVMAVTSPDRDLVALLWDNRQHWLGEHDQPSAVFASPNLVESGDPRLAGSNPSAARTRENHLMGLFTPSIPDFLDENELYARTPVTVTAAEPIVLRSVLLARARGEVLDAVTEWLELFKPESAGDPPKPLAEHYALSVRAFEELLYTEGKGWAGVKGWDPGPNPETALMYLYLADRLGRPELRRLAIERSAGYPALALSLHIGSVAGALHDARDGGLRALRRREPNGNWVFRPTEKTASLGDAGDTNVGMAAGTVRQILRAAAQTADPYLLREGLKGLDWMRRWRVPRGAQVWEIPLHAPDILASAHCCAAFLWGYRLTGDESYLRDAVYWARTGIPFVYFWQTPTEGLEPMRGGTIPIFGATFYVGSWYGRLVQWCGLEYARVLLDLAPYDDSHDWRAIAGDITVSGWRQQQEKEGFQGLYPDSWSMLTGAISWGLMLGPSRLVHDQLALDGLRPGGDIRLFRRGASMVSLLGPGEFVSVSAGTAGAGRRTGALPAGKFDFAFQHRFRVNPDCYIALVGVTEPRRITVDGVEAPRLATLSGAAPGWLWSSAVPGVVLKLRSMAREPVSVVVEGLDVRPAACTRTHWTFDDGAQGWVSDNDLAPLTTDSGALVCTPNGGDPYLTVRLVGLDPARYTRVRIRCRTRESGPIQVFWATSEGGFAPERAAEARVAGGDTWQDVELNLSHRSSWRTEVIGFRIDPPAAGLAIDDIQFLP